MAELASATSSKYALAKHTQRGVIPGCKLLSQELEPIGNPFKRSRGISFTVSARICSLEEEFGNPSEKNFSQGYQGGMCKTQSDCKTNRGHSLECRREGQKNRWGGVCIRRFCFLCQSKASCQTHRLKLSSNLSNPPTPS